MGEGLKRVARLCGGLTVTDGKETVRYTATGRVSKAATGQEAIIRKLRRGGKMEAYYGQSGWVYTGIPKGARRADLDELMEARKVRMNSMHLLELVED